MRWVSVGGAGAPEDTPPASPSTARPPSAAGLTPTPHASPLLSDSRRLPGGSSSKRVAPYAPAELLAGYALLPAGLQNAAFSGAGAPKKAAPPLRAVMLQAAVAAKLYKQSATPGAALQRTPSMDVLVAVHVVPRDEPSALTPRTPLARLATGRRSKSGKRGGLLAEASVESEMSPLPMSPLETPETPFSSPAPANPSPPPLASAGDENAWASVQLSLSESHVSSLELQPPSLDVASHTAPSFLRGLRSSASATGGHEGGRRKRAPGGGPRSLGASWRPSAPPRRVRTGAPPPPAVVASVSPPQKAPPPARLGAAREVGVGDVLFDIASSDSDDDGDAGGRGGGGGVRSASARVRSGARAAAVHLSFDPSQQLRQRGWNADDDEYTGDWELRPPRGAVATPASAPAAVGSDSDSEDSSMFGSDASSEMFPPPSHSALGESSSGSGGHSGSSSASSAGGATSGSVFLPLPPPPSGW